MVNIAHDICPAKYPACTSSLDKFTRPPFGFVFYFDFIIYPKYERKCGTCILSEGVGTFFFPSVMLK